MMAAFYSAFSTAEAGASISQNDIHQGSRKRKQDMPSAPSCTNSITPSSNIANQEVLQRVPGLNIANQEVVQRVPELNTDKLLLASIKAVVSFNFPEHIDIVRACALDMRNRGEVVNSQTLLEKCELHFQENNPQNESYSQRIENKINRTTAVSEAECVGTFSESAPTLSAHLQTSIHHSSEYSSLQLGNTIYSSNSRTSHNFNSIPLPTKEPESSSASVNGCHERPIHSYSLDSALHNSMQSREPSGAGEDYVDGSIQTARVSDGSFDAWAHSSNDVLSSFTRSHQTLPTAFRPVTIENIISNVAKHQDFGLSNRPQSSGSNFIQNHAASNILNGLDDLRDIEDAIRVSSIDSDEEEVQERFKINTIPLLRTFSQENPEYNQICFELLEKEHALLEKSRLCSMCSSKPRNVTFLPCGHFTACRSCAEPIFVCPCCDRNILATVDTYMC